MMVDVPDAPHPPPPLPKQNAGFNAENSIALVGVCRDEICSPFVQHVVGHFGHTFGIRGLGGFISCGRTGFGAAQAHSPVVGGKRSYVYFVAPHIAIDEHGMVSLMQGLNRSQSSQVRVWLLFCCDHTGGGGYVDFSGMRRHPSMMMMMMIIGRS